MKVSGSVTVRLLNITLQPSVPIYRRLVGPEVSLEVQTIENSQTLPRMEPTPFVKPTACHGIGLHQVFVGCASLLPGAAGRLVFYHHNRFSATNAAI
jgi:hypothetical protein